MDRRQLLVGLAASGAAGCAGAAAKTASANPGWAGDADIIRRAYSMLHPGLYRYSSKAQTDARLTRLGKQLAEAPDLASAYLSISAFCGSVRCGHTYANFYNQSDAVAAALFSGRNRLPFHFVWLGDRMVVTLNQSVDARLARGAEILSINGRRPADIQRALLPLVRADGGNDAKRRALLDVSGADRFETFDIYYPLVFPMRDERFALSVRPPGATTTQRFEVAAIDLVQRRSVMTQALSDPDAPQWTLAFRGEGAAVLTMPTWGLYDSKWDWRAFLAAALDEVSSVNAGKLIVDLRGNEGGLDCGNPIIARLIDRELDISQYERKVRYRRTPADLDPLLDTWDSSFRTLGEKAEDMGDGFFRLPPAEGVSTIKPEGARFTGAVTVLTDAQNSSATFQFAQLIQDNGLGRLCGAPTGGNQRGINGGAFFFLRLPATGIEVDLPLIGRFPKTPRPDAGLLPDIAVQPGLADVISAADPVMAAALAL